MVDDQDDKLKKLAEEAKDDDSFKKIDELEKELDLDEESDTEDSDNEDKPEEKKTVIEKVIEETPAAGLINNNPLDGRQP
ncbi:hypothetical protein [Enterococcus diestrammenae]|uniref:hypothetical protein n=1 Tax=Enterococcus diestrammenae TaxID=1155073 RepID=UPI0022E39826|nr:hypothetical protein [Enterococcus diestrammenae]